MALVKCKECGAQISQHAATCPSCGVKRKGASGCLLIILLAIVILFFVFVVVPLMLSPAVMSSILSS